MSTPKDIYSSTAKNSIAELKNFIDGYTYGPLRALAQEPSQNSKDASASRKNPVVINYELIERTSDDGKNLHHYHLVVTDTGTTGLGGPVLTIDDLKNRGHILRQGEEWAAFEGMNYTKEGEDYLGSRGVGKRAFLYFSMPPIVKTDYRIIIYDTLLEGGEYRLGARKMTEYDDKVLAPPITGNAAQETIKSVYVDGDVSIPLKLEPLGSVGTRVIVPYVDDTVIDSIRSGEFNRWLQLLWWRAIQVGELQINVIDDEGEKTEIQVPHWWEGMPWENEDSRTYVYEDISLEQGTIKRIVLFYDEDLLDGDIPGYDPQYCGVQLMRKRQWISTLDVQAIIPKDKRGGFRGFVEFSVELEKELRGEEGPTHEYFNKKKPWVREVHKKIENIAGEWSSI